MALLYFVPTHNSAAVEPRCMIELSNQLTGESSPYLHQHRRQPVSWQLWSPETLSLARELNKPILLSIGYSACHWCHVMARESFDDEVTAGLMNEHFINVKVDREERPDLDDVYQTAHQMLTGRPGGWPLTLFLCPQTQIPFLAGTYFPKQGQQGLLGFDDLLLRVMSYYRDQQSDFCRLRTQVEDSYHQLSASIVGQPEPLEQSLLVETLEGLAQSQDSVQGGFGSAPKFPLPVNLTFLLPLYSAQQLSSQASDHLLITLTAMAERGINDRIGGGFFRYSTDADWHIPHFEKMLYDNGLLLDVYARAWQLMDDPLYKSAALGIVRWLRQHMLAPQGAFFSAMDAETNGREGDYYALELNEVKACLSGQEFELFERMFGLKGEANFSGRWHFSQRLDLKTAGRQLMLTRDDSLQLYRQGREKLEALRTVKPLPFIDHKILTGWNGLVIKGLMVLARNDELRELALAQGAIDFIRDNLWVNNRLFAAWQGGQPCRQGFLDDYVYLMDALLESLQTCWRDEDYRFVITLAESLLRLHEDTDHGGFFYTAHDSETLIYRSKPLMDSALPAANGVAARVFLRLGHLAAEPRYLQCARRIIEFATPVIVQSPCTHLTLVQAREELLQPIPQVILLDNGRMQSWEWDIRHTFFDRVLCYRLPQTSAVHPPEVLGMEPGEAIVCAGDHCQELQTSRIGVIDQLMTLVSIEL